MLGFFIGYILLAVVERLNAKTPARKQGFFKFGGEGGIRTLDTLPYTHFPGVLLQPLGHLTKFCAAVIAFRYQHRTGREYRGFG